MSQFSFTCLTDRAVIKVTGDEAEHFLQNLITCDVAKINEMGAAFGALLTPQGKIQFDFFVVRTPDGYLLDAPQAIAADLAKRLTFYKLRSKVEISLLDETNSVFASWGELPPVDLEQLVVFEDPRLSTLGTRIIGNSDLIERSLQKLNGDAVHKSQYTAHRIKLGVPESISDFAFSDIFPHDADMEQLNGVSFTKGCYVGQEVVSRMQHRSSARKRMIQVNSNKPLAASGTDIMADGKSIGTLGSSAADGEQYRGVALVRLDKVAVAREKGATFSCGDAVIDLAIPNWAEFDWPSAQSASE
ncbi:MAG: folate-binding protein YgfZ [Rhodobacteraceae bacterium]|nr:folate-binding protein YgfZ [Paracoccaceae bacterium]